MSKLMQILVATDFSELSLRAVARGSLLAKQSGAQCNLLHVLGLDALEPLRSIIGKSIPLLERNIEQEARESLQAIAADATRNHGIEARIHLKTGQAYSVVSETVTQLAVELLLIGAHGVGFLEEWLMGSTTSRLLRKSPCPVLVVKQPATQEYRRALIAVDFSPASPASIRAVRRIAPEAHLVLMHVFEVPFEGKLRYAGVSDELIAQYQREAKAHATQRLHAMASEAGLGDDQYTGIVMLGDPARQILAEQKSFPCDLIALGKHGVHVTEELLLGSVTRRVLAEAQADLLVVVDERASKVESLV